VIDNERPGDNSMSSPVAVTDLSGAQQQERRTENGGSSGLGPIQQRENMIEGRRSSKVSGPTNH